jgi:hypothetical protein
MPDVACTVVYVPRLVDPYALRPEARGVSSGLKRGTVQSINADAGDLWT